MSCNNSNDRLYCMNCGKIVHGFKAKSGKNKFSCPSCRSDMLELGRTRRSITIEMVAPCDYICFGEESEFFLEDIDSQDS